MERIDEECLTKNAYKYLGISILRAAASRKTRYCMHDPSGLCRNDMKEWSGNECCQLRFRTYTANTGGRDR